MKTLLRSLVLLVLVSPATGCAGGWRGGAAPAEWSAGAPSAPAHGTPAMAASTGTSAATHATADGILFVWTGEGNAVNAAGDFNAWSTSADPLVKDGKGRWTLAKKLAPGKYAYKFVIDGTNWKPDPGVTEGVDDGFGGKNSLVVVGGGAAGMSAMPPKPAASSMAAGARAGGPTVTADGAVFHYSGPGNAVNLAGEFNAWSTSADALVKGTDGTWTIAKKLPAGRYMYKFVIDGTNWKEDPNAAESADDGFGGKNSVVVVGPVAAGSAVAGTPAAAAAPAPAATGQAAAPTTTDAGVVFRYSGPANSVNLAGEFNAWSTSADALTKGTDGVWTITKKLAPGKYPYKFVLDGTNWKPDPAATESVDDGFGGKNSLVTVGGAAAGAPAAGAVAQAAPPPAAVRTLAAGAKPRAPQPSADGILFTYAGPAKTGLALCGDFNNWATTADPMKQQADGTWILAKKLAPGTYAYKFLVDGSSWKTDDGNSATRDDGLGGKNSIIVVK